MLHFSMDLLVCDLFDQRDNGVDCITGTAFIHRGDIRLAVLKELKDAGQKAVRCKVFFLQYHAKALFFKGSCIEDLVPAACGCRKRDQKNDLFRGLDRPVFIRYPAGK